MLEKPGLRQLPENDAYLKTKATVYDPLSDEVAIYRCFPGQWQVWRMEQQRGFLAV